MNRKKASFQATLNHIWVDRERETSLLCQEKETFGSLGNEEARIHCFWVAKRHLGRALIRSAMKGLHTKGGIISLITALAEIVAYVQVHVIFWAATYLHIKCLLKENTTRMSNTLFSSNIFVNTSRRTGTLMRGAARL